MAASPSFPSWFTSLTCNPSSSIHQTHSFLHGLRFIFLSPCPQRLLFSAVDTVFLFLLLAFALHKLFSRLLQRRRGRGGGKPGSDAQKPLLSRSRVVLRTDLRFKLALAISSLLAAFFAVLLVLALTRLPRSQWQLAESAFLLLQSLSHLAVAALIAHEKRFRATTHPATLRVFWIASVLLTALLSASAVLRFVAAAPIFPDDPLSLVALALSVPLLLLAVSGSTGVSVDQLPHADEPPALSDPNHPEPNVTLYATASILSCITWSWMTPLLSKGYRSTLNLNDVPTLAPDHRWGRGEGEWWFGWGCERRQGRLGSRGAGGRWVQAPSRPRVGGWWSRCGCEGERRCRGGRTEPVPRRSCGAGGVVRGVGTVGVDREWGTGWRGARGVARSRG